MDCVHVGLQELFSKKFKTVSYAHTWELVNIEALKVIIGPKIKPETKFMAIEELISETVCIQQRIIVRNTSVSCVILLAHARNSHCRAALTCLFVWSRSPVSGDSVGIDRLFYFLYQEVPCFEWRYSTCRLSLCRLSKSAIVGCLAQSCS